MKHALTEYQKFERKMKNLEPGVRHVYFTGESIGFTRAWREDVDKMAFFALAVVQLGYGAAFQTRNAEDPALFDYTIVLNERLGMRKDLNGRFQEAERIAAGLKRDREQGLRAA